MNWRNGNQRDIFFRRLSEDAARFYAAEVLVAFEHMHTQDIIYRDLKVPMPLLLSALSVLSLEILYRAECI